MKGFGTRANGKIDSRQKDFSLWDEARNTGSHQLDSTVRLRDMKMNFVPAGTLDPADLLKPMMTAENDSSDEEDEDAMGDVTLTSESPIGEQDPEEEEIAQQIPVGKLEIRTPTKTATPAKESVVINEPEPVKRPAAVGKSKPSKPPVVIEKSEPVKVFPPTATGPVEVEEVEEEPRGFMFDFAGDEKLAPKQKQKVHIPVRAPSPTGSVSSNASEKIVFIPRSKKGGPSAPTSQPQSVKAATVISKPAAEGKKISFTVSRKVEVVSLESKTIVAGPDSDEAAEVAPLAPEADFMSLKGKGKWNEQRSTQGNKRRRAAQKAQEKRDVIEDYMENIAATLRAEAAEDAANGVGSSGTGVNKFGIRDLPGGEEWMDDSSTDDDDADSDDDAIARYKNDWAEDELEDFDGISTDEEGPKGTIHTILRKRTRPSGVQYLIKWTGESTSDATWVLQERLDSTADAPIKLYEEEEAERAAQIAEDSSTGSESDDEYDSLEDDSDDNGMEEDTDLQLAQLLQRHEDLGLDVSDLDGEIMDLDSDFFPMGKSKKGKKKKSSTATIPSSFKPDRRTGAFPSASATADSFDLMDWSRPSIALPQSKKHKPTFDLSDSSLQASLTSAWANDRAKKKGRKAEREALRAAGLLGASAQKLSKPDLKAKYKTGMTMNEVFDEIRAYMLRDHDALPLPPMDKRERKLVHELAGKLNLKSKSVGAGHKRFCTLFKTKRSAFFEGDEEGIDSILRNRGFMKRSGYAGPRPKRAQGASGGGGPGMKRRDGELVGGDAPVLGSDNRGRLMLEKMGYVQGMGLGLDGKGVYEPVIAVVKVSKAGLG